MCGVVGASLDRVSKSDIDLVSRVFLETEIRGKHASGFAWFDGKRLHHRKEGIPISEHLENFDIGSCVFDGKLRMIGHIRYSTSDLLYHQPIGDNSSFIVHNGVVTQEDPENWEAHYGIRCSTKNDSEILFHHLKTSSDIEGKFPKASYALLRLTEDGISYRRNGLRPLYIASLDNGRIFASTFNILLRAGVESSRIQKVECDNEKIARRLDGTNGNFYDILQK